MKYKISVTTTEEYPVSMHEVENVFGDSAEICQVTMPFRKLRPEETKEFTERLHDSDGILVRAGIFEKDLLEGLDKVKVIGVHGAGYDQVDVRAAAELGIAVVNAPGANANAVAELTLAFMLVAQRQLYSSISALKDHKDWVAAKKNGQEIAGKKLGLIGFGNIAKAVATRAKAFSMDVMAYSRSQKTADITIVNSIEPILREADIISLHLPLNDETKHIINAKTLAIMQKHSIIINTSRGELINEQDLCAALKNNTIGGACLDVFETEPLDTASELFSLKNVLITPHIGGSTYEALDNVARMAAEDMHRFLVTKEPTQHLVNSPTFYK